MRWIKNLHHVARNYTSRGYIVKDNSTTSNLNVTRNWLMGLFHLQGGGFDINGKLRFANNTTVSLSCRFNHDASNDSSLGRDFLAKLWVLEREMAKDAKLRKMRNCMDRKYRDESDSGRHQFNEPRISYTGPGFLPITSPEEAQVADLLERSNLLITRDIEWANLVLGFEQENRYAIVDVHYPHSPVGFIREQSNVLARQLLRTRRPFVAYVTDGMGNELFQVRRPFWWITSSIYAVMNGKEIGVVHRRWHLWRRIYDLYVGSKQFAVVENPGLWNWTFTLKDIDGNVLAQIDRDWRGFGFELFTDAGQYVIRFGSSDPYVNRGIGTQVGDLEVVRPLTLSERAVTLALAVSLDNDYFSRHGGWGIPFFMVEE